MKLPISWLAEYVDVSGVEIKTICDKLVSAGFEVAEVIYRGENLKNVVVGKILSIKKHPDADKLVVCSIDVGQEKLLQIVTGATNVFEGAVVPVALDNSYLPCGKHITKGKLRGVESEGMLCGGSELCIDNDIYPNSEVDGIVILSQDEKLGEDVKTTFGLDEYVLDIEITANRPDCGCIYGMAREVAAVLDRPCKPIPVDYSLSICDKQVSDYVSVEVLAKDLCPNYSMAVIDNVKIEKSPLWLTRRLSAVGLRGISNLVDITNYVLMELGQPMHAFDYADIDDKTIIVRRAKEGETIIPLNQKKYQLNENVLVIADKQKPVGLAGIMGGINSGISADTKAVAFESAVFARGCIRKTSRALGIRSDSSARFEKGLDDYTSSLALDRALHLVCLLDCGSVVKGKIQLGDFEAERELVFPFKNIERLLGIKIDKKDVIKALKSLGIETTIEKDSVKCLIPKYRKDISRDCDIIEEVIRIYGYDKIHSTFLSSSTITMGGKTSEHILSDRLKNLLCAKGYSEIVTYSFGGRQLFDKLNVAGQEDAKKDTYIKLLNPLGEEYSLMRQTLAAHMLEVISNNLSHNNERLDLFELSRVYFAHSLPLTELPKEQKNVCIATDAQDGFYKLKDNVLAILAQLGLEVELIHSDCCHLHPNISANIMCGDVCLGYVGQVHPAVLENFEINKKIYLCEMNFDIIFERNDRKLKFKPIPKHPGIVRDFALVCDEEIESGKIVSLFKKYCKRCESVKIFDVYHGEQVGKGKKSIALTVLFRGEQTLGDKDIEPEINKCLKELDRQLGAKLR